MLRSIVIGLAALGCAAVVGCENQSSTAGPPLPQSKEVNSKAKGSAVVVDEMPPPPDRTK